MVEDIRFPPGFQWGASTAAFLMEGDPLADGAGLSVQHTFRRTPGNVPPMVDPDAGIEHYRRFREDIS
ncbi:MAG: family 1 glycosylhydrolase, partial [Stackebrandtia sp.]